MMKARLAYEYMHGNPAAQRMVVAPDQPYVFDHGDTGTHFMASMDNYAVPLIQDVNGQLMLGDFGPESAEAMKFDNPEDAMYFAEHYKDVSPAFIEADLTPEEIQEYAKGGYIIEDISVPSLNQNKKGGEPKKKKRKTDDYGRYRSEDGNVRTPITPEMQAVMPPDEWGQYIQEFPEVYTTRTREQQEAMNAAKQMEFLSRLRPKGPSYLYLPDGSLRPQAAQSADWVWGLGLGAASGLGKSAVGAAEALGTRALPYIEGALNTSIPGMASIPGATIGNAAGAYFAADAIVNRLYPSAGKIQEGKYGEAAADIATGVLDLAGANMLSPAYKGAKATVSELGKFLGTEEGLLSNAYKVNPWAFKPNSEAGYRMIGGKEGYLDAVRSGEIRPTGAYDVAHFNIGQPLNPNRLSAEELIQAGSPGGYKGPYMAEMEEGTWQRMSDAFSNNPEMQEQFKLLGKDKDVWQHPLFGNIKVNDPRLKLYKEHWLKGYKEVPKELPDSPNNSFSIFPKQPVPLQGYDLSKGQAYKTIYSNPEHEWHNQSYKDLYEQMLRELEEQKKLSDELADFDPLDKMNNSVVSNEAYKNLLMGDDLKWKIDDDLTTPRIPFNKSGQRAEGVKFHSKVEYKPMDPKTRESINVLNNIERGTNRLPMANQARIDINALMDDMTPLDFVKEFRMNLKDP
jgi:hypothetical protein